MTQEFVGGIIGRLRISSEKDLQRFRKSGSDRNDGSGMADWAAKQIEAALSAEASRPSVKKPAGSASRPSTAAKTPKVSGESLGEASVRLALMAAFGDWHRGGEVVQELIPFGARRFRCDFALPRWRCYVEMLLTPADILIQTEQDIGARMHTGMSLVAREL